MWKLENQRRETLLQVQTSKHYKNGYNNWIYKSYGDNRENHFSLTENFQNNYTGKCNLWSDSSQSVDSKDIYAEIFDPDGWFE